MNLVSQTTTHQRRDSMSETDLTLDLIDKGTLLPPLSARECTQTLTPIPGGSLRRTINGALVHVGKMTHRKFSSTISCKDKRPPAFEDLWEGVRVKVGCIQHLTQSVPQGTRRVHLEREPLSLHLYDENHQEWPVEPDQDLWILIPPHFPGGFLTYRPLLTMIVKKYHLETDEWGLTVGWSLELEEE
jgi:hypothetical protein